MLSYVYEHEKRDLASRIVSTQHHHHDLSVATLHVHINHDDCLETTDVMMNILQTPQFTKYTLWFMTNQIAPESGQIAPALAHFGQNETTSPHSGQKTG